MNTITNLNTFPIGNSLDGINIVTDEINTLSLLVDGTNSMLADLNMNNHIIKNMEAGVDSLDAVNKSQLDLKADTTYVNTQLALKVNKAGDTMTGALNMNTTNKIINLANGTNNGDAVNRSQLNTKADTSYVNTQLGLKLNKAGDTMTGALNMNSTNKIINLANGTSIGDAINLGQLTAINNSLTADINDLENYVNTQDTALRTYTDSSLNSLRDYINSQDTADRVYVDSSLNLLRNYVNTQDNLKVSKAGDTMTGNLLMSGLNGIRFNNDPTLNDGASLGYATNNNECILSVNSGASNKGFDLRVSTGNPLSNSTRIWAQADGKVGINTRTPAEIFDVNGNSKISGYLDMNSNKIVNLANGADPNDAINKSQLDNVDTNIRTDVNSALNLKVNKAGDTMTDVLTINKNATTSNTSTTDASAFIDLTTGIIYNKYNLTYNGAVEIWLSYTGSGNTNLQNKLIHFNLSANTSVKLKPKQHLNYTSTDSSCNINGTTYFDYAGTPNPPYTSLNFSTSFGLSCSGTIGTYTTIPYDNLTSTDQLTLKSNLGTNANSEFTGIRFLNTNTDAGLIRVETNLAHTDSIMRFYTRVSNAMTLLFDLDSNITAYKPIIRNAWSSGELIKTTIFSRATTGVSKVANVNPGVSLDWLFPTLTLMNTPTNSIVVMDFDAPYHFTGASQDTLELSVYDTTGGTANLVFRKSQYYDGAGGGGTRSGPIFPFSFSHTPSQATTTATRTYVVAILVRSGTDILRLCQGVINGSVEPLDYYTCEMKEIKI